MVELIDLTQGIEQQFTLPYDTRNLQFNLSFDDFSSNWFIDILDVSTSAYVLNGIYLIPNIDVFKGLEYLNLGHLSLVDTEPSSTISLNVKNDLGARLKLYREL